MKNLCAVLVLLISSFLFLSITPQKSLATGQNGTTLNATNTATAHYSRTFHWSINKSVTPDTFIMFRGDSGTANYTVNVTKDRGTDESYVDGQICVTNGGDVATENLAITDNVTMPPDKTVIASETIDVSSHPVLSAGETHCYDYQVNIPSGSVSPGSNYKDTADVTITNHSGHLDDPFGPGPSATSVMPASPTLVNDSVNVDDSNGSSWNFSTGGSQSYSETFTCDGDAGTHNNTATIRETNQSDSAFVTVNCYALSVSKTAATHLTRTTGWAVGKTADQSNLTLATGESFPVNYTVTINTTGTTDSDWEVSGTIAVENPAPMAATINGVSDIVTGSVTPSVSCGVNFPYSLPAGETLNCTYSGSLPDGAARTNTATVTLANSPSGTTDFTGTAGVNFSSPTITEKDICVSVSDSLAGALGLVCTNDTLPKTFTYTGTVGPYTVCGPRNINNTATFTTNDNGITGSSTWTLAADVPCVLGCTLTIGYWKNHTGTGPGNQADMVTAQLPVWLGTAKPILPLLCNLNNSCKSVNVNTVTIAKNILSMSYNDGTAGAASNGISKLYAQLLAAKLNIKSGASNTVGSTISAADTFLGTHNQGDWATLSKSEKNNILFWMTVLDNYNNGLVTVPHCSQ